MNAKRNAEPASPVLSVAPDGLGFARLFSLLTTLLAAIALPQLFERGKLSGSALGSYSLQWLVLLSITMLLALVNLSVLIVLSVSDRQRLLNWLARLHRSLAKSRTLAAVGFFAAWMAYVLLVLYRYQKHFSDFAPQVWLFFLSVGIGALFLALVSKRPPFFWLVLFTALLYGAGVRALGFLPEISSYPFSLSWSEGSRYYYASLPFARWLYGVDIPLSFLHPSRYLLQGLAFLAPGAGIAFHRFWQVALWLGLSLLAGLSLARRFRSERPALTLATGVWAGLFLLQGPVYYHLLVSVILVLWGFDRSRFWKTLVFVILASFWAGISRVNWIPVPVMLAVSLFLLEQPVCASIAHRPAERAWYSNWLRYLWQPAAWSLAGIASALAAQAVYVLLSGHEDVSQFGSSFTSALLWYRLLPSATNPDGIIPSIVLVALPVLVLLAGGWLSGRKHWHPLRVVGIILMLLVLLAGGLVVSTKIGGGSNLHNLDAFITLLMVVGAAVGMGGFASETGGYPPAWRPWPILLAVILLPVVINLNIGDPFIKRDFKQAAYDLGKLDGYVQKHAASGEVLMITQRQLEVFDILPGVPIVPEYELMTLTEMAMSNNQDYLARFYNDLENHRFALIVADRQHEAIRDPAVDAFAEENNAWVEHVSKYILKYYQEEMFFDTQGIQLLVPKKDVP